MTKTSTRCRQRFQRVLDQLTELTCTTTEAAAILGVRRAVHDLAWPGRLDRVLLSNETRYVRAQVDERA